MELSISCDKGISNKDSSIEEGNSKIEERNEWELL